MKRKLEADAIDAKGVKDAKKIDPNQVMWDALVYYRGNLLMNEPNVAKALDMGASTTESRMGYHSPLEAYVKRWGTSSYVMTRFIRKTPLFVLQEAYTRLRACRSILPGYTVADYDLRLLHDQIQWLMERKEDALMLLLVHSRRKGLFDDIPKELARFICGYILYRYGFPHEDHELRFHY